MPSFALQGFSQTLPDHIEGWFVNKLNKLKCLAEQLTASENKFKQEDLHCFSNGGAKNWSKMQIADEFVVKQMSISDGDIPLKADLSDFKMKKESSNLFSELAFQHSDRYGTSLERLQTTSEKVPFSELLKVAKKIEKVAIYLSSLNRS